MKLSASIYSNKEQNLEKVVEELDEHNIDYLHIDCSDDDSVFEDIQRIRQVSSTPIDLHLITDNPEQYFDKIEASQPELVCFQYENLTNVPQFPTNGYTRYGIAISSETPYEVFKDFQDQCSFILFMTTTPGESGGRFNRENFQKIRHFRQRYPGVHIHVDGGVNEEVSFILRNMGVHTAVTGSYLMRASSYGKALLHLKSDNNASHFQVKDFMLDRSESPVITKENPQFNDVLHSIEHYGMAFTLICRNDDTLVGLISNADVRKGMIRHIDDLNNMSVDELINRNPAVVKANNTVEEMLNKIKNLPFPVLYLPVVNDKQQVVGVVKFNNLIKGES